MLKNLAKNITDRKEVNCSMLKEFIKGEEGVAFQTLLLLVIGAAIAVIAFLYFRGSTGSLGNQAKSSANTAANGLATGTNDITTLTN
jgi:hypothetical protein